MADDVKRQLEQAQKRVAELKAKQLAELSRALQAVETANAHVVDVILACREAGISYREMRDATGRSHEYFRAVLNRARKR